MKANILLSIKLHNKDNPITSRELEKSFGITGGTVRSIVRELRREGKPIISTGDGYFYSESSKDIEILIADLHSRATDMLQTAKIFQEKFFKKQINLFN